MLQGLQGAWWVIPTLTCPCNHDCLTAPNHLEHTLQLSHLVSVHADTKTGPPPARRGLDAGNTNPQCLAPHCNPFQPFCFQGEPLLQDLEEAEVCGGPHAHDCHSRHHRAALSALWRCSPSVQVSSPLPSPPLPSPETRLMVSHQHVVMSSHNNILSDSRM